MKAIARLKIAMLSLLLFISSIVVGGNNGVSPEGRYSNANKLYRSGNYAEAGIQFESLVNEGKRSTELFFNLGNCYYKQGDFAKAVLNYERAKRISPTDEDIIYNLKLANSQITDKIEPIPQLFYERWWEIFLNILSPTYWSVMAISLLWIAAAFIILYLFGDTVAKKKTRFFAGGITLILSIFLFIIAGCSNNRLNNSKQAIVMSMGTYVKSSPDEKSTNLFMLHSGTKIDVIEEISGWKKIKIANGNAGWMKNEDVEKI